MGEALDYYSFNKLLSYQATYNFIVGGRGIGKTYGAKVLAIQDAIKKHEEFIYLRRYKSELKGRFSFFSDLLAEFPEEEFRIDGLTAQIKDPIAKGGWRTIGYFAALSTSQTLKSVSYPKVTKIIFDEFIIEKGSIHYLPNEVKIFNDFYSTVDRWKDKTKVFFIANSISVMNPYFIEFDIKPEPDKPFIRKADGFLVAHFPDSEAFKRSVLKTKFGKFIASTNSEYVNYAVDSQFADNNDNLIDKKTQEARYYCTIETKSGLFSVWINLPNFYIQEKRPKQEVIWTLVPEKMTEDKTLVVYSDKLMQMLRSAFRNGNIWFDTPKARNIFTEVFRR